MTNLLMTLFFILFIPGCAVGATAPVGGPIILLWALLAARSGIVKHPFLKIGVITGLPFLLLFGLNEYIVNIENGAGWAALIAAGITAILIGIYTLRSQQQSTQPVFTSRLILRGTGNTLLIIYIVAGVVGIVAGGIDWLFSGDGAALFGIPAVYVGVGLPVSILTVSLTIIAQKPIASYQHSPDGS